MTEEHAKSELTSEEVGRRVRLAREYVGYKRKDLEAELERRQFPYSRLGRIERGEKDLLEPMRKELVKVLGFPEEWFTAPDDELFAQAAGETEEPSRLLASRLDAIEAAVAQLSHDLGVLLHETVRQAFEDFQQGREEGPGNGEASGATGN